MKKVTTTVLLTVGLALAWARGASFPDDVPDLPGEATALGVNAGTSVPYLLQPDQDRDWFTFPAWPLVTYTASITAVTVSDLDVTVSGWTDGRVSFITNSAFTPPVCRLTWMHDGPPLAVRIGVRGLFGLATGTYQIAVSATETDADGDNLPDRWELDRFGTLTNAPTGDPDGDGATTRDEFQAGTHPNQGASVLRVLNLDHHQAQLSWPAAPYGRYMVQEADAPHPPGWMDTFAATNTAPTAVTMEVVHPHRLNPVRRVYRVRVLDPSEP